MNERVATYFIDDAQYGVYACYNSKRDMDKRKVAFYDIYNDRTGKWENEGDPFEKFPSWKDIFHSYYAPV